jgi:hypothetical protein
MKIFKFWTSEKVTITIDREQREITCWGGSNLSVEDAKVRAREKADLVERKIEGDQEALENYEVEIREEILKVLDDKSIITRNRYGAQVLNTESLMFLDIDGPKISLAGLFKRRTPQDDKQKIFDMVRKLAAGPKYSGLSFRLYETFQGARVIVLGRDFNTHEQNTVAMMKEFNSDPLYTSICQKQGCFRARLTPKPTRIKMKTFKVKYPRDGEDVKFQTWLKEYEYQSKNFSSCKFIEQIGTGYAMTEPVRAHDEITGATMNYPLA